MPYPKVIGSCLHGKKKNHVGCVLGDFKKNFKLDYS